MKSETTLVTAKIEVGQTLYKVDKNTINEVVVEKVGTKYFYLAGYLGRYPINKDTIEYMDKEYTQDNFRLYRSKQEISDLVEIRALKQKLSHYFYQGRVNNTLEELRSAVEILKIN